MVYTHGKREKKRETCRAEAKGVASREIVNLRSSCSQKRTKSSGENNDEIKRWNVCSMGLRAAALGVRPSLPYVNVFQRVAFMHRTRPRNVSGAPASYRNF